MRIALVVGVDNYDLKELEDLKYPIKDASEMKTFLEAKLPSDCCFQTELLSNPSRQAFEDGVRYCVKALKTKEQNEHCVFFIFFAGHGILDRGETVLLCKDVSEGIVDGTQVDGGMRVPYLQKRVRELENTDVVFFFDSCRSVLFRRRGLVQDAFDFSISLAPAPWITEGQRALVREKQACRLIVTTCSDGEIASDNGRAIRLILDAMRDSLNSGEGLELGEHFFKERVCPLFEANKMKQRPKAYGDPIELVPQKKPISSVKPPKEPISPVIKKKTDSKRDDNLYKKLLKEIKQAEEAEKKAAEAKKAAEEERKRLQKEEDERRQREWEEEKRRAREKEEEERRRRESREREATLRREEELRKYYRWRESWNRPSGTRQTLSIKGQEYGFRWALPGTFSMGTSFFSGIFNGERKHRVTLTHGFWIMETPVTQRLWKDVTSNNPSSFQGNDLPVECVSWYSVHEFLFKLNQQVSLSGVVFRLPTESEWEYACRAGSDARFCWGDDLNGDRANCNGLYPCGSLPQGRYVQKTTPVKSYRPNAWGLYDMHGNVAEWCEDWCGPYPWRAATNPKGPAIGKKRVSRGGSWASHAEYCRSATRICDDPTYQGPFVGFRIVISEPRASSAGW